MRGPRTRAWVWVTATVLGMLAFAPGASAATFTVNSTVDFPDANTGDTTCADILNRCTLRAAIEQANAQGGPDQVNLPPGTYSLGTMGQLTVSSSITIEGTGSASNTTIAQTPPGRVLEVTPGGVLDLRDATVRDGFLAADGGGILSQGTLTLRRVVVANNEANNERGGGIAIHSPASGNTTILDSTIGSPGGGVPGNRAGGTGATGALGGGIYHEDGALTVRDSTVAGNRVDATPGSGTPQAIGGAIVTADALVIENSTIRSNLARVDAGGAAQAGGILVSGGQLTMRRSTVAQNQAVGIGAAAEGSVGGVWNAGPGLIEDSTIAGNRGQLAAGLAHTPASLAQTLTVRRSAVTGNVSEGIAAGGRIVLESSTLDGNGAGPGLRVGQGGAVVRGSTISGHATSPGILGLETSLTRVTGSILDGNVPNCREQGSASVVSGGYNVDSANSCGFAAAGDRPSTNPLLGPLQANGGPTATRAIASGSPARDAVTDGCPPPSTDQRGVARPQGPACDSGAFEFVPIPAGGGTLELSLSAKDKQKANKLTADVACGDVACTVDLGGKGKIPKSASGAAVISKARKFKLKPKQVELAAGATETVRMKFRKNRKAVKKIKALLKQGGKRTRKGAKAVVSATATGAGVSETAKEKIKLKR